MSNPASEVINYKSQLLDHLINAVLDAIQRARAAWLLGVIIVFVFGVAIFNSTLSWNDGQIDRRASLYNASVQGYDEVDFTTKSNTETGKAINKALNEGDGELGYLSPIWKSCQKIHRENKPVDTCMAGLKEAIFFDLKNHVSRRHAFDTVSIPFIGVSVAATDYGIVGGIALIIVGYWLMAMLRREHLALNEFVTLDDTGMLEPGYSKFSPDDLVYACHRIKHHMVFSIPEPSSWLSYVTTASFFTAPFLLLLNHFLTGIHISKKGLGEYWQWHVIAELLVAIIGVIVWVKGWLYQHGSMRIMHRWEKECRKKNRFQSDNFTVQQ